MDRRDLVQGRPGSQPPLQEREFLGFEGADDGPQAIGAFGVAGPGVVIEAGGMGIEQGGHGKQECRGWRGETMQ